MDYIIDFTHIKGREERLDYLLGNDFFEQIEGAEILGGDVRLVVTIRPLPDALYDLTFSYDGTVTLPCDRCLLPMELPMTVEEKMSVQLGESLDDENDEFVTLNAQEPKYDFGWIFYELLALHLPLRHVHPDPKECDPEMLKYLVDTPPDETKAEEVPIAEKDGELWQKLRDAVKDNDKDK